MNLFYREYGRGTPVLFLHGGWGYEMYPIDAQVEELHDEYRFLIPDRTGYGKSNRVTTFPRGFHEIAAQEMRGFLDARHVDKCVLWGHSDGAVTAVRMGIAQPERFIAIIAEAIHFDRCKPASRPFFETAATNPRKFGGGITAIMARDHGEDYWEFLIRVHGHAWLDILDNCADPAQDLYSGRIGELRCPTLLIHGSNDPRTEPLELKHLLEAAPGLKLHMIDKATHSPHSEQDSSAEFARVLRRFLLSTQAASDV